MNYTFEQDFLGKYSFPLIFKYIISIFFLRLTVLLAFAKTKGALLEEPLSILRD